LWFSWFRFLYGYGLQGKYKHGQKIDTSRSQYHAQQKPNGARFRGFGVQFEVVLRMTVHGFLPLQVTVDAV
jgi:hypothetical protein